MVLQVIEHRLIKLSHTAHTNRVTLDGNIKSESMTHGRHVARMGKHDIAVIVTQVESLVVALSIVGRECHTNERNTHLIAPQEAVACDRHFISNHSTRIQHHLHLCLSRVVTTAIYTDSAQIARSSHTCSHIEAGSRPFQRIDHISLSKIVEPSLRITNATRIFRMIACTILVDGNIEVYE